MELKDHKLTFTFETGEIGTIMTALRGASVRQQRYGSTFKECPFFKIHAEFVRLTGWGREEQNDLITSWEKKNEKEY